MKPGMRQGWMFCASLAVAITACAQAELHPVYEPVVPGLDYAHVVMKNWNSEEPWSVHIARMDRSRKDLHIASMLSQNQILGLAPISVQAKSVPKTTGVPLVAINTDFCIMKKDPYQGAPRGLQVMEGQLVSPPFGYSFWVNGDGGMNFGRAEPNFLATLPGGRSFSFGMNHECKSNSVVLFTPMLGKSTRAANHLELVLEDPASGRLSWRAGGHYALRVKAVNPTGDTPLSGDIAVLSFGSQAAETAGQMRPGDAVDLDLATEPDLTKASTASACIFPLLSHGEVLKEFAGSRYLLGKHPRTAIGFNERYFYMVVVDGRQPGLSMGMFPAELARFMAALGCAEAMNMDGGGSSTFWLTGKVRNSPSDKRERNLANGLVIVQRASD
jgi:hypothetical protein